MDTDILETLYRRYYSAALLYATSLCGDTATAEDLVADAFVKAYLTLPDETPSFPYWLFRVCRNLWIDQVRRQKHLAGEDSLDYLADTATPETRYLQDERNRALWKAIGTLSPPDRELVTLHYFADLPLEQIAKIIGKSHPAVRQRLRRLRLTLKQRMEEQGYGF